MRIDAKRIWQQAAGGKIRDYVEVCLNWGVILNGPGDPGHLNEARSQYEERISSKKLTDLKRFADEIRAGDIVVLRVGTNEAHAVGEIVGDYEWHPAFEDIDGWDLQHVRRVKWLWRAVEPVDLGTYAFKQGDTTQLLTTDAPIDWLKGLKVHTSKTVELRKLPDAGQDSELKTDKLFESLFDLGLDSASIEALMGALGELTRIGEWYERHDMHPSEAETIAFLVNPFLRAIGWTPQKMAVEWKRVDVALFHQLPRKPENLAYVVEAKKRGSSCLMAKSQAEKYAKENDCRQLTVTDGIRYGVFEQYYGFKLRAYLNLLRLRQEYSVLDCDGATEAIWRMSPEYRP